MKLENINFILNMTKDYLDGKIDFITFGLDFPYEVETRYRKMVKEDREIAELESRGTVLFDYNSIQKD